MKKWPLLSFLLASLLAPTILLHARNDQRLAKDHPGSSIGVSAIISAFKETTFSLQKSSSGKKDRHLFRQQSLRALSASTHQDHFLAASVLIQRPAHSLLQCVGRKPVDDNLDRHLIHLFPFHFFW